MAAKTSDKPEKAVVRLTFAMEKNKQKMDASQENFEYKEFVEIDQDDKSVAMNGRLAALPYTVTIINQSASRCAREDFLDGVKKLVPEFFAGENMNNYRSVMTLSEQFCSDREYEYISSKCSEYELPHFEVPCNVHMYD